MAKYTTFKIGGEVKTVLFPSSTQELESVVRFLYENGIDYLTVGNGSNLLFSDDGYDGYVVITTDVKDVEFKSERVRVGCGVGLTSLSKLALDRSLTGLEFAYGIPGSVGGAVYMNAGAFSGEISQILESCRCFDNETGETVEFDNHECDFSYRNSIFEKSKKRYVILEAVFKLSYGNADDIRFKMEEYMAKRRANQPLEYPSAGSAFKRAPGYFTAKLIDDAGLKGARIGGAEVSTKHAGFIINKGGATSKDVADLIDKVKETVKDKFGVDIEPEIRIVR